MYSLFGLNNSSKKCDKLITFSFGFYLVTECTRNTMAFLPISTSWTGKEDTNCLKATLLMLIVIFVHLFKKYSYIKINTAYISL